MYKVYLIRDIHGLKYVGCTKKTLKERLKEHEYHKRNGIYLSSSKLDFTCCKITILEDDITEENKKEKEQYWIDKIDCVKEYDTKYNNEHKKQKKQYREENKEKHQKYHKEYRAYQISWGGRPNRNNNSLLKIDIDLFK